MDMGCPLQSPQQRSGHCSICHQANTGCVFLETYKLLHRLVELLTKQKTSA